MDTLYRRRAIRDFVIDADGNRYRFVGTAARDPSGRLDVDVLRPSEGIVTPALFTREIG